MSCCACAMQELAGQLPAVVGRMAARELVTVQDALFRSGIRDKSLLVMLDAELAPKVDSLGCVPCSVSVRPCCYVTGINWSMWLLMPVQSACLYGLDSSCPVRIARSTRQCLVWADCC